MFGRTAHSNHIIVHVVIHMDTYMFRSTAHSNHIIVQAVIHTLHVFLHVWEDSS